MMTALVSGGSGWPVLIQKGLPAQFQLAGPFDGGPEGLFRVDGDAVHGGGVKIGRGDPGKNRFGQDPAQPFGGGELLGAQHLSEVQAIKE